MHCFIANVYSFQTLKCTFVVNGSIEPCVRYCQVIIAVLGNNTVRFASLLYTYFILSQKLAGWSLKSLSSAQIWLYQRRKFGWKSSKGRPVIYSLVAFLFRSHPAAHLNYYASAYNRGR